MTTVGSFHIDYTQYLDADGEPVRPLPAFAQDAAALLPLYRADGADTGFRHQGDRAAAHR
jgi:hypothetical protein